MFSLQQSVVIYLTYKFSAAADRVGVYHQAHNKQILFLSRYGDRSAKRTNRMYSMSRYVTSVIRHSSILNRPVLDHVTWGHPTFVLYSLCYQEYEYGRRASYRHIYSETVNGSFGRACYVGVV